MPNQTSTAKAVPTASKSRPATLLAVFLAFLALTSPGCNRDPNVRKLKFVSQGDAYFKDGKYPEAQISYARALQIDARYVPALYKSAQCSMRLGNWNGAYQELLRTVDLDPVNWPAQLDLGKIYLGGGKFQDAKARAMLILHNNPNDVDAKILLSNADTGLGNQKDALSEAREAVELAPTRSATYLNLAVLQQRYGAYSEAEANFRKAQSLEPASIVPHMFLGGLYEGLKRTDDARKE